MPTRLGRMPVWLSRELAVCFVLARRCGARCAALLAASSVALGMLPEAALAQEGAAAPAPSAPEEGAADASQQAGKDKKKPKLTRTEKHAIATTPAGIFGVKGRVFAGLALRHRADRRIVDDNGMPQTTDIDSLDIVLDSARLSLLYQSLDRWLSAEVEVEVSDPDQVELRDAYMEAEQGFFSAKAGNFKLPGSAIELESAWTLPSPRRGFVNELLEGYLDVAGRRPGVQVKLRADGGIEPTLVLGVFQGSVVVDHVGDDRDTELLQEASLDAQSWAARGQIELGKLDLGVFFEHRVGSPAPLRTEHYPVVGADAVFDEELGDVGLRLWLDGQVGESFYRHVDAIEDGDPWFLAARAIAAVRYGGTKDEMPYSEVFVAGGMLDPDLDVTADWARELSGGFNFGYWDRARLTLEGFISDTSRNFPDGYFGGPQGETVGANVIAGVVF